jgi:hypothetical protein
MSARSTFGITLALDPEGVARTGAGLRTWLSSGTCQSPSGAFVAWCDLTASSRSYDYPEITGYALTFLAGQTSLSERECAVGQRAADWLTARVRTGALAARDGWDNNAIYLFDLGMIASGLLSFGRRTEVERYLETGLQLANFLRRETSSTKSISPVSRHGPRSRRVGWSSRGVAHLGKLCQALLLADEVEGRAYGSGSARLIATVERLQAPDGRIQTDEEGAAIMLHPHLYAAEGLWIWGSATGDRDALERAKTAVEWVWTQQLRDGGLPRSAPRRREAGPCLEQSDVTAQAVRLALMLGLRSAACDRAVTRLIELARNHDAGLAVAYQPGSPDQHLNTWATLFAAQALAAATPEVAAISWRQLV